MWQIDWLEVRRKAEASDWAGDLVLRLRSACESHWRKSDEALPMVPTAWIHFYFCDRCGVRLKFDFSSPLAHECPSCRKIYAGEPKDGSWRTLVHDAVLLNIERACVLGRIEEKEPRYREYARRMILFYAGNYRQFEVHGRNGGFGRIMPQCLDESLFLIGLTRCVSWSREWFSPEELSQIARDLVEPAVDLIRPQISKIHNIHAWMQAFLANAGNFLDDGELIKFAVDSEYGWRRQIEAGVNEDGFWFEGSLPYHFYCFEALMSGAWALGDRMPELLAHPKLFQMLKSPLGLAYQSGELPAHNDAWAGKKLADYAGYYEWAHAVDPTQMGGELSWIYSTGAPANCPPTIDVPNPIPVLAGDFARCSMLALLVGRESLPEAEAPGRESRQFPASGIGILESEQVRVCLRAHPDCGNHDHKDKLAVDVYALDQVWSMDFGMSGYGAAISNAWYRTAPAHNMVVVNRQGQAFSAASFREWNGSAGRMEGVADDAYPGVKLRRAIRLLENGWEDVFSVESDEPQEWDWCFHGVGRIVGNLKWIRLPGSLPGKGYDQLTEVECANTDEGWSVEWINLRGKVVLHFEGARGSRIYRARCPGHPAGATVGLLMVRRNARATCFRGEFRVGIRVGSAELGEGERKKEFAVQKVAIQQ